MNRRDFLVRTGAALAATAIAKVALPSIQFTGWDELRRQFLLSSNVINMTTFYLASHPQSVRAQIDRHRRGLDANPFEYLNQQGPIAEREVLMAASTYLGARPSEIALTDSTTMGLGLLYGGMKLRAGQEILTSEHDHYSTEISLRLRAQRTGTRIRKIRLYAEPQTATEASIVQAIRTAITPQTRLLALTWVHSVSGVKIPVRAISDLLAQVNRTRSLENKVLFSIDAVHALGVENFTLPELGCDFFVAGTHKWLFGPRGTGFVWAKEDAWPFASAIIPTFDGAAYQMWMGVRPSDDIDFGPYMTPGGFHSFEHRWSVHPAFRLHLDTGKDRVQARIYEFNRQLKEALRSMRKIRLRTPLSDRLSAGITCFEVEAMSPQTAVQRLRTRGIVASVTPYSTQYVRLAPGILNSPDELNTVIAEVRAL